MERLTEKKQDGSYVVINGEFHNVGKHVDKLGKLEDIEKDLGIDLIIGGSALINGIFTKYYGFISGDCLLLEKARIYIPMYSVALPFFGPVGYGVTWALTKKELKNDK